MKVLLFEADAAEAIVTFREVSTQDEVSAVAAAFGLDAISAVRHGSAVCAVHGVVAQPASRAVRAPIAVLALVAEHAVRATSAFFTGIADGVSGLRRELLRQAAQLLQKPMAVNLCNPLFSIHGKCSARGETSVYISIIRFYGHKQMDKFKYKSEGRRRSPPRWGLYAKLCARDLTFAGLLNKQLPPSRMAPGLRCLKWSLKKCRKGHTAPGPKTFSALGL